MNFRHPSNARLPNEPAFDAHFPAASGGPGSRRYDASSTTEQRTSIENGLWCCRDHGTLIDTDEVTYSTAMLKGWRVIAEKKAELRHAHGDMEFAGSRELVRVGLVDDALALTANDDVNGTVGNLVVHCCVADIWGRGVADSVRDFLIEHTKNAFEHAAATQVLIKVHPRNIVVEDNGRHFELHSLADHPRGRGGRLAYRALLGALKIHAISSTFETLNGNVVHVPLVSDSRELAATNPCTASIDRSEFRSPRVSFSQFSYCDTIYIIAPDFLSYSDLPGLDLIVKSAQTTQKRIAVVVSKVSDAVIAHSRGLLSDVEIISW
ncbi:hypothetical protein [Paraburkholderia hospita]|uniref:hypothetical protein n=1 Tax=Paraburkholderia hospita TaxID=169430 RepID=UPI0002717911|nr:hypothetical protein [Paraburkholderia hospita]EUC20761.1 hypothetical protein PMI06_009813 [Burkholderia sp. BT03]SKD08430.1 hypothetical protein SAMN06266956_10343 [Paraburkholderia hospita]